MWHDDGSNAVCQDSAGGVFVVSGEKTGSPVNARFEQPLSSGQYFEVKVLALASESRPFIGVTSASGFGQGWRCRGLLFGGPGNLSTGSALAKEQFGYQVEEGMTVGVYIEYTSDYVTVTFYQDGRCLGPAFAAPRLSDAPIFPVVQASCDGDRFSIDFPAHAPVEKERVTIDGGRVHPASDDWLLEELSSSEGVNVDLADKMPYDEARVGLEVGAVGETASNKFMLCVRVLNRLKIQVTVAPDPAPPHAQSVQVCLPLIATRMAGPPEMMELEEAISSLLASLTSWQVDSNKLTLRAPTGQLIFSRNAGGGADGVAVPLKDVELP